MPVLDFLPTANGSSNLLTPKSQNCLDFDGVDDLGTVTTASWASFGAGDFTVECQVMKKANSSGWSNLCAFGKWDTVASSPGTNEWLLALTSTGNDQKFAFSVEVGSTTYTAVSTTTILLNTWYHVAGVRSGTSILIYVNGTLEATTTNAGITTVNTVAARDLLIGKIAGFSSYTNMKIANIRIFTQARTQVAINAFKEIGYEVSYVPTGVLLAASYSCEQGTAGGTNTGLTTLNDVSVNGRNCTLSGFALSGADSNWVLYGDTASTNWECVQTHNFDQTYMLATTTAQIQLFSFDFSALPNGAIITGVGVRTIYRRSGGTTTAAGTGINAAIRTGGTTYLGLSGNIISGGPAYQEPSIFASFGQKYWRTNPNSSTNWTQSHLSTLEAGIRINGLAGATPRVTWVVCSIQYRLIKQPIQSFGLLPVPLL